MAMKSLLSQKINGENTEPGEDEGLLRHVIHHHANTIDPALTFSFLTMVPPQQALTFQKHFPKGQWKCFCLSNFIK